ncbi:hypothetical protein [Streptomyces africanus]|uniref:hypothetical protein n=1 Tax=Streptomyces africanus TaxID=231024 RepID=UPI000A35FF10|nr:hypothetical protein [Streptomyces africanus]
MPRTDAALHRRCLAILNRLSLPDPFSAEKFCHQLAAQRGRPVHLHPLPKQAARAGACGLWLETAAGDHIFYEQRTVRPHQEHIILHEIGHMLLTHHTSDPAVAGPAALVPDLDPGLIHRLLARTNYTTRQEREAETLASVIRVSAADPGGRSPRNAVERLQAAFGMDGTHAR